MCGPILFVLVLLPAVEIFTMFRVGSVIGFFPTMLIVIATAFFGLAAVRGQGFATLDRLRGQTPMPAEVLEGPLLIAAAALLLFPGFFTDAAGLALLVPPLRRAAARRLSRRLASRSGDPTVIVIEP